MSIKNRLQKIIDQLPKPPIDTTPIIIVSGEPLDSYPKKSTLIICKDDNQRKLIARLKIND